jgi:hypothetical protein
VVQTAVDVPGQAVRAVTPGHPDRRAVDPVEAQQTLLRFADEYSTRMIIGVEKLRRGTNILSPAETLHWKIAVVTETTSIVSGPNTVANLLDMTIFVAVTRMALETHWQPKTFGESALPMLESCRNSEAEIWRYVATVLTPEQQAELLQAIESWHQRNPLPESVLSARALGFSSRIKPADAASATKPGSVFALFGVDPLAGMDPAVREIAQTRLFAERTLYVTQKMPMLLRWQAELLSLKAMEMPEVRQLVTNSTDVAASVERFAAVAENLPAQVSAEREEILKALESQEKKLTPLVNEVRQTLAAGSQMSVSLNSTLTTFDGLMARFGVGETNQAGAANTSAEPFRIQDYRQTAAQLEATARQLTELLRTLDQTLGSSNLLQLSAKVGPVIQQAKTGGKTIVNYAFGMGVLLLAIVIFAALIYRFLVLRAASKPPKSIRS